MGDGMKQFLKSISQFIVPIILLTYVLVPILNDRSIGEQFNQNNAQIKQFIAQLGFGVSTQEKMVKFQSSSKFQDLIQSSLPLS